MAPPHCLQECPVSTRLCSSAISSALPRRPSQLTGVRERVPGGALHAASRLGILNHMVQYTQPRLDDSFAALSDATRRGVLEQLGRSDASITELADRFDMTLTGMKKH